MKIIHETKKRIIKKEGEGSLFLSDRNGGYLALGSNTQYAGWSTFLENEWTLYKLIEDISLVTQPEQIVMHGYHAKRIHKKGTESFFLKKNALIYSVEGYNGPINIKLDFRRIHDYDYVGRIYNITNENGAVIVEYIKYTDSSLTKKQDTFYLAIRGNFSITLKKEWLQNNYQDDERRKIKSNFYVFNPFFLSTTSEKKHNMVFGFGKTKQEALTTAKKEFIKHIIYPRPIMKDNLENVAAVALSNLVKNKKSILAGLPWFYQVWSRDELISLIGLIEEKKYSLAKEIVLRYLHKIDSYGKIENRYPHSSLGSADAIGWLFKRASEIKNFTNNQKNFLYKKLMHSIENTRNHYLRNELVYNNEKETWMDTFCQNDSRAGYRVEIQALHLNMYKLAKELSKKGSEEYRKFGKYEADLKHRVIRELFIDGVLRDGLDEKGYVDMTTRPNVFLAYYIYPELLRKEEWKKTFGKVIEECWLNWGGFSSISRKSPLFQPNHTGIDNKSYHNGDSWYYINNIAAICLNKLDKKIYGQFSEKIKLASTNEMLFSGFFGQCAELSSASVQTSEGCLAQAWSAATLLELLKTN